MSENKNLVIAILLSAAVLIAWQYFYELPRQEELAKQREIVQAQQAAQQPGSDIIPAFPDIAPKSVSREEALAQLTERVTIANDKIQGSIVLEGARFDDITLLDYTNELDPRSGNVALFSPSASNTPYFAQFGWLSSDTSIQLPGSKTLWTADKTNLNPGETLTLHWDSPQNIRFILGITMDKNYLFTVTQSVANNSNQNVTLHPYGVLKRHWEQDHQPFAILHEGPIGVIHNKLEEVDFSDLIDDKKVSYNQTSGWIGFSDKYWLASLIPDQSDLFNSNFTFNRRNSQNHFQVDFLGNAHTVAPGSSTTNTHHLFAGAKIVTLLDQYGTQLNIPLFDRAVDFGWLYFITKPIFLALKYFNALLGNFGLAILLLTVIIKLLMFPLANKGFKSMNRMKALHPKILDIKERYGDDKTQMHQAVMKLYQEEKVNPVSGCLPILLQLPVFFALYKVLFVTIEMRHAPFYGWIHDLSAPDPTSVFTLFGLIPIDLPGFLTIGIWPILMCLTMVLQQKINPPPTDPTQAMIMKMLPFIFLFLFASFPAGLVIYWAWSNLLSILQQRFIARDDRTEQLERQQNA